MHILSGQHRGRRLLVPKGKQTRPTLTRVRQVLFDMLQHGDLLPDDWSDDWSGLRVLDVCAGGGSLGLEALSRGAAWVGFYENDPQTQKVLVGNINHLQVEKHCAVYEDVLKPELHQPPVDLVLCDPPYRQIEVWQVRIKVFIAALRRQGSLNPQALLVIQTPKRVAPLQPQMLIRQKRVGITRLDFYHAAALS